MRRSSKNTGLLSPFDKSLTQQHFPHFNAESCSSPSSIDWRQIRVGYKDRKGRPWIGLLRILARAHFHSLGARLSRKRRYMPRKNDGFCSLFLNFRNVEYRNWLTRIARRCGISIRTSRRRSGPAPRRWP